MTQNYHRNSSKQPSRPTSVPRRLVPYLFTLLLVLSLIVAAPIFISQLSMAHTASATQPSDTLQDTAAVNTARTPLPSVPNVEASPTNVPISATTTASPSPTENASKPNEAPEPSGQAFTTVDKDYFDDALFIGDSRTMGLSEYSDLNNATFFANTGMTVFKLFDNKVSVRDVGTITLPYLLNSHKYGNIYLMLGVNELGYPFDSLVNQYEQAVNTIRSMEPDAVLYLCANLHVTKQKSDNQPYINNSNIDKLNAKIAAMADGQNTFYIDVNVLFDDASGNLDTQYSHDNAHVLGVYYKKWGEWLCTQVICP